MMPSPADLYLDLLKTCLSGTLHDEVYRPLVPARRGALHWMKYLPGGALNAAVKPLGMEIVKRVRDLLHYQTIALSAGNMPSLWCEFTEPATRDPDGVSWHGVLRFRAVTEN